MLDPNAVMRNDPAVLPPGAPIEVRGAEDIASRAMQGRARHAQAALIDGAVGVVIAPRGHLRMVIHFTIANDRIATMEVVADSARLSNIELAAFSD